MELDFLDAPEDVAADLGTAAGPLKCSYDLVDLQVSSSPCGS